MKRLLFAVLLSLPLSLPILAQDCRLPLGLITTAPINVGPFDNRVVGCNTWVIDYNSQGFSAVSLIVQTAPNAAGGVPGAWSTFAAVTGINPNTATTQAASTFGGTTSYFPWLRVQLTSKTGTGSISGILYGWKIPGSPPGGSGCVGTIVTPCVVDGPNAAGTAPTFPPILGAGIDGTNVRTIRTDTTGNQQVSVIGNGAVLAGQQTVTATAVALASNAAKNICVKALLNNTAAVYIGPTAITTSTGMELQPGDSYCAPVSNTNLIFVRAAAAVGDAVSWISTN